MRSLRVAGLLLLCGGFAACSSSATTAPASGSGGGGGGGVASSFHAWCVDYSANQTVVSALFALENGLQRNPPGKPTNSAADMGTAATDAATLAAESVAVVHFPGTAMPDLQLGADMNGVAQTLKTAAAKMANGDTSGYGEVGPGAFNAAGSTNGLLATLDVVTSACTTFGGVIPNQQNVPTTAAEAPATAAPATPAATTPTATEAPTAAPQTTASTVTILTGVALQVTGSLLTDGKGMAVYTFGQPGHGFVEPTTELTMFPPALAATAKPAFGPGVAAGGTRALADGTFQLTYSGQPLYTCTYDTVPGTEVCAGVHMHFYVTP